MIAENKIGLGGIKSAPFFMLMKKLFLFLLLLSLVFLIICVSYSKEEHYAKEILGDFIINKCKILKVIEQDFFGGGFAIFLSCPKKEFAEIKEKFNHDTWRYLEPGREILVKENDVLRVPEDINGLYIVILNPQGGGLIDVIIWDERNETIVLIAAEATI